MRPSITAFLAAIRASLRTRDELEAEILALRHQLAVLEQTAPDGFGAVRPTDSPMGAALTRLEPLAVPTNKSVPL
jgi:hypothetical protein